MELFPAIKIGWLNGWLVIASDCVWPDWLGEGAF